jgi:hypothetical protein
MSKKQRFVEIAKSSIDEFIKNKKSTKNRRITSVRSDLKPDLEELDRKIDPIINQLPSLEQIFKKAIEKVKAQNATLLSPHSIRKNFSEVVCELERTAFSLYLTYQDEIFKSAIDTWITENEKVLEQVYRKFPGHKRYAKEVCERIYPLIQRIEFRAGQKRKARGGGTFQIAIEYLLRQISIPCESPKGKYRNILKRIDLVIPNQDIGVRRPDQALFLSCKRTLRERWKQAIPERKPSWRVFLITVDDELPEDKANEINSLGMIIFVKDELKSKRHLVKKEWVRKLSDLPENLRPK